MKSDLLRGKVAVITGARSGIGLATAECFANNGADLIVCLRKENHEATSFYSDLAAKTQVKISPAYFDLSSEDEILLAVRKISAESSSIDILINNAAILRSATFQMSSQAEMKELFSTNFFGQIKLSQLISRIMARKNSGSIVNVSSSSAQIGDPGRLIYASAKAALETSTRVMARELAVNGIRVNAVAPGLTRTAMAASTGSNAANDEYISRTILQRMGEPREIANACLFLASDLSSYITGQILAVDGGL